MSPLKSSPIMSSSLKSSARQTTLSLPSSRLPALALTPSMSSRLRHPRRTFTTAPKRQHPSFFDLGARAVSRENLHFAKQARATGEKYIEHSPALQLLRSERDLAEGRGRREDRGEGEGEGSAAAAATSGAAKGKAGKRREREVRHGYAVFNQEELARRGVEFADPIPDATAPISTTSGAAKSQIETAADPFAEASSASAAEAAAAKDRLQRAQLIKLSQQVSSLQARNDKYRAERAKFRARRFFSSFVFYLFTGVLVSCLFVLDRNGALNFGWLAGGSSGSGGAGAGSTAAVAEKVKRRVERGEKRGEEALARVAERVEQPTPAAVNDASLTLNSVPLSDVAREQSSSWLRRLFWKD